MKKIKIGIPRAFHYHRYGVLWKNFFESLGCKTIISPETTKEILNLGIKNTNDKSCLSYKIYIGHVIYLIDKCDYIITTRICDYGKKDKVCPKINSSYDEFKQFILKDRILMYDIEHTKLKYEFLGFLKIGFRITRNPIKIIYSYFFAKAKQKKYNLSKNNENKNKLLTSNKKILIMSHFYNIQDKYISSYVIDYLIKNNITPIKSNFLDTKTAIFFSEYFSNIPHLKYSKEMIGSLYYYKYQIDGLILISTHQCEIDKYINPLIIYENKNLPILHLIIDENVTISILKTKIENYLTTIKDTNP